MPRQNLSQQTADRLYTTIVVEQQLQPGEKLPNELELAQQLGVSRATLREAIRTLADRGVLEVRRGRGHLCLSPGGGDRRLRLLQPGAGPGTAAGSV